MINLKTNSRQSNIHVKKKLVLHIFRRPIFFTRKNNTISQIYLWTVHFRRKLFKFFIAYIRLSRLQFEIIFKKTAFLLRLEVATALQNRISVSILKAGQVLPTEYYASVCAIATLQLKYFVIYNQRNYISFCLSKLLKVCSTKYLLFIKFLCKRKCPL